MRTIIVTGANGFIGKYVVDLLLKKGVHVLGIGRNERVINHAQYVSIKVDIADENELRKALSGYEGIEGIVHLAANLSMHGNSEIIQTNCVGTYNLANWAVEHNLKCFINMSSIPVIGVPMDLPITESHFERPQTIYHVSKLAAEQIVNVICANKLRVINMRISSPIGCGMNSKNLLSTILNKCIRDEEIEIYGQGTRVQNYIDVRDVVSAIDKAIQTTVSGLYLVAGTRGISNLDLAEMCKLLTHSHSIITCGKYDDPEEWNRWDISIEKARKDLNYQPNYQLKDTIAWIVNSMRV